MTSPRLPLSRLARRRLPLSRPPTRYYSSSTPPPPSPRPQHDPVALLSQPTWSIRTLIPPSSPSNTPLTAPNSTPEEEITPAQLSHLLRLSALPQPSTPQETRRMLATLHAQLHFVRDIQRVNTDGVEPLSSIRDETAEGMRAATITVDTLKSALAEEEVYGRCRRPRRRRRRGDQKKEVVDGAGVEDWDVLGCASEKVGRYFVVRSGSGKKEEEED
ncbi:uncharacterized protein B0T15DRAFT_494964 [Chaetomium strumarium]|uniref:Glutamyl-tRNA amidotransferase complex subunit Gta3 domain-containing protein n=1 Tax=Chaetomium strumarium TaxID=1170767 RepID=A0AAJ0GQX0_9PEZI|nr:hypothetical protein B0T15DRAFT_494964 [Chaetomium strumarium]